MAIPRNPIVHISCSEGGNIIPHPPVQIPHSGRTFFSIGGHKFAVSKRKDKNKHKWIVLVDKSGRLCPLEEKDPVFIDKDGLEITFNLVSDFIRKDDRLFKDYFVYSALFHCFLLLTFGIVNPFATKIHTKDKSEVDMQRVKTVLQKIKDKKEIKKPAKLVRKQPPPVKKKKVVKKKRKKKKVARKAAGRKGKGRKKPARRAGRKRATGPSKEQLAAKRKAANMKRKKAQLSKSLGFLSTSQGKFKVKPNNYMEAGKKYSKNAKAMAGKIKKGKSVLAYVPNTTDPDGPIQTKGVRGVQRGLSFSEDGVRGGKGISTGNVRGRVATGDLYGGGGEVGGALSSDGGLTLSGKGSIAESLIEKALAKHLQKLQYCYEKSLLTDATLSGTVKIQWDIFPGGKAKKVKVVRSQMNNKGLHSCITREIGRIKFPSPRGGSVTVTKPFSFSSTSL